MKTKRTLNLLILAVAIVAQSCASLKNSGSKETITIQTNAECGQCKEKIEGKLNYTKGITFAELDIPTKVLTVKYKTQKISPDEIRTIVSQIGYDADDVKADPTAQENLPKCCKPGGMN